MKEAKVQWHSAFVSAMELDFGQDRAGLIFEKEYNLKSSLWKSWQGIQDR